MNFCSQKTQEIGTIYGMYEALLERGFADPDDDLTRAEELLKDHPFFKGWRSISMRSTALPGRNIG